MRRLQMDLGEFGATYSFIDDRIRRHGGGRGTRAEAIRAAADHFNIDPKTAERRYERLRGVMQPLTEAFLAYKPSLDAQMALIRRAFAEDEMREFEDADVSFPLVYQLALERLELIELRMQRSKRK